MEQEQLDRIHAFYRNSGIEFNRQAKLQRRQREREKKRRKTNFSNTLPQF